MISVERFDGTEEEWDAFAAKQTGYTHFHRLRAPWSPSFR